MSLISVTGSYEDTTSVVPSLLLIDTSSTYAQVQAVGFLNGATILPSGVIITPPAFLSGQKVLVNTTDMAQIFMNVYIDGSSNVNLVPSPMVGAATLLTTPPASSSSSLALGTAYQNTLGYDVMLSVYVNVTSALTASFLLGVGPTSSPTQQTIVSGLTVSLLGVIPVTIYLPSGYYAKLSTSGTIIASIGGQIMMPV